MTRPLTRVVSLWTRLRALQQAATFEGGFAELIDGRGVADWKDMVEPWTGHVRLVPAANATSLKNWRHGTVHDLTSWVLTGCHGWGDESKPVVVAGTRYRSQLPAVRSVKRGGEVKMLTLPLNAPKHDTPNGWARTLLRQEPNALLLCVIPRG